MRRKTPRYLKALQALAVVLWLTWGFSVVWSIELLSPKSSIGVSNGCAIFTWSWPARLKRFVPDDYILSRSDDLSMSIWPRYLLRELVPSTGRMTWPVLIVPIWILAVPITVGVIYLRRRRPMLDDSSRCGTCDFILAGNESGICPECGTPIESAQSPEPSAR